MIFDERLIEFGEAYRGKMHFAEWCQICYEWLDRQDLVGEMKSDGDDFFLRIKLKDSKGEFWAGLFPPKHRKKDEDFRDAVSKSLSEAILIARKDRMVFLTGRPPAARVA